MWLVSFGLEANMDLIATMVFLLVYLTVKLSRTFISVDSLYRSIYYMQVDKHLL